MKMHPRKPIALLVIVCALAGSATAVSDAVSIYASAGGSSSIGMLGRYADQGVSGSLGLGLRPFPNSRDVELTATAHYDRFGNVRDGMGSYSFIRFGTGIRLNFDAARPNRLYLMLDLGSALVRVDDNSGFPPYRGKSRKTTNLYGAGGFGFELGATRSVGLFAQAELIDILDTLFGDYRFIRLSLGLRL